MDATTEKLVLRRDRWVAMAMEAPTEAIRAECLRIAHLYEVDVDLTEHALRHIAESKELIAKVPAILGGH
jgi:hypothetical protein